MENLQGGTLALEHRYHIESRQESAGLITIYGATQDPFQLPVRVIVYDGLPEAGAATPLLERIKASAREASELDLYGVLQASDFGEIDEGLPFVIEEVIAGRSLSSILSERGVLSLSETLEVIEGLAKILEEAHKRKRYHGNLQPRWIWIPEGKAGFSDPRIGYFGMGFGMAELLSMSQAVLTTDLVEAFAPECFGAAEGNKDRPNLSADADQWALASLAYRLLVGVHPFFDDPVDASEGILRIKSEEAPSLRAMGISEEVAEVIARGLRKNPAQRWQGVGLFARRLREAISGKEEIVGDEKGSAAAPARKKGPGEEQEAQAAPSQDRIEYRGPRPSGYLLTIALMALVLTNLGWYFFHFAAEEVEEVEIVEEEGHRLLSGLQLHTSPPGAQIYLLEEEGTELLEATEPIGSTPHVLPTQEDGALRLLVRLGGFRDQRLFVEETAVGQDLRLILEPRDDL